MKKSLLWVLIILIMVVFTLVSCNKTEVIGEVVKEDEEVITDESIEESESDIALKIVELAKSQKGKLTGVGPFASLIWADSEYTYCDRFVSAVITVATGGIVSEGYQSGYYTAYDHYIAHRSLIKKPEEGGPPKGAVVYFDKNDKENGSCGHVGIYDGEGNVISVVNKKDGVLSLPLKDFKAPFLGWVTFKEYESQEKAIEEKSAEEKTLRPTSREKPATLGETIRVTMDDWLIGEAMVTFEIEMTEVISGDKAWEMVKKASQFNVEPGEGMSRSFYQNTPEYILAKFRFKIIETEYFFANIQEEPLVIYHDMFSAISSDGIEYPEWFYFSVLGLEPELDAVLYKGDEFEGWTFFLVNKDDNNPLAVFEGERSAETWFKLRP